MFYIYVYIYIYIYIYAYIAIDIDTVMNIAIDMLCQAYMILMTSLPFNVKPGKKTATGLTGASSFLLPAW
jgi:hypothetical protein